MFAHLRPPLRISKMSASTSYSRPRKPPLTHFLCLPLHNALPQLSTTLATLHTDLVETHGIISSTAVRPAVTLHLTLGVMSLPDPADLQRAVDLLHSVDYAAMLEGPLTIDLVGLEAMGDRRSTSVLYAVPVDGSGRLRAFAEGVRGRFVQSGLVVDEKRELKLHATVVNTVYSGRGRRGKEMFDAVEVVDRYTGFEFAGGVVVDRVAVCRMGEVKGAGGVSEGYLVCGEKVF